MVTDDNTSTDLNLHTITRIFFDDMTRTLNTRKYGKSRKTKPDTTLFAELPSSLKSRARPDPEDTVDELTHQLNSICIAEPETTHGGDGQSQPTSPQKRHTPLPVLDEQADATAGDTSQDSGIDVKEESLVVVHDVEEESEEELRTLTWDDVCPPGVRIQKIAEASYAEVYRISNDLGTSIIKVIRLESPIKAQTKAQEKSGLVDEVPHAQNDLLGELTISERLADIPGFVVYKERYVVKGKAPKTLLETHQTFHRKMKRKDPDRLQFYPSPSRYLDDTQFLVVELGDAGTALEDFELVSIDQVWDIFLHVAIALARAEDQIKFEHRDLHEGNLCIRQVREPKDKDATAGVVYGYSGLEITILDYGLSRADDVHAAATAESALAYDLEKDLSLFTSTHAPQCKVYRQMRSYLLTGDRVQLPPKRHSQPYEQGPDDRPISWFTYAPFTNVLWLAYIYEYLTANFKGDKQELAKFKATTKEFWSHLNPAAPAEILSFSSAVETVRFAIDSEWLTEAQLFGEGLDSFMSMLDESCNHSIVEVQIVERDETELRRSPRRRVPRVVK